MTKIAKIALDLNLDRLLSYKIPESLYDVIKVGSHVEIPLKSTIKKGMVLEIGSENAEGFALKEIASLVKEEPLLPEDLLKLSLWMSAYYITPLSKVLKTILPSKMREEKQERRPYSVFRGKTREELREALPELRKRSKKGAELIEVMLMQEGAMLLSKLLESANASRSALDPLLKKGLLHITKLEESFSPLENADYIKTEQKLLNGEQQEALALIQESLRAKTYQTHLLFGVTGSGKTEVYLRAIDEALKHQMGAIMLVPEIALTGQTIERLLSRFDDQIAILHHRLSDTEKRKAWQKIRSGEAKIVIGARSSIFSPVKNLGLIIVDEEHESSYKQSDQMPCYHAREVAIMRAKFSSATCILGSATPSLESYQNALNHKYRLSRLTLRPSKNQLPAVSLIDMKKEYEKKKGLTVFSDALLTAIEKRMKSGEQTLLFLNRRGYHSLMLCKGCGKVIKCPHCDLSLTYHKGEECIACHFCAFKIAPPPKHCPSCRSESTMKFSGVGTEHVENALHAVFKEIRTLRLDADTTKHKGSHDKIYRAFRTGKADVLIGTQMIAKGLHFPEVTLVGVLNSDLSLNVPDFRAAETTFQLLTQVAGRAGRGLLDGEVLIQTTLPEHSTIQHAKEQDYLKFFHEEIEVRKLFSNPPFAQIVKVKFQGKEFKPLEAYANRVRKELLNWLPEEEISPVEPPCHAKVKDTFRLQILIKGKKILRISEALRHLFHSFPKKSGVQILIDPNPTSTYF